jgi:hypothetical protein
MLTYVYILLSRYLRNIHKGLESQSCVILFNLLLKPKLSFIQSRACLFIVSSLLHQCCQGSGQRDALPFCCCVINTCFGTHTVQTTGASYCVNVGKEFGRCSFQNYILECLYIVWRAAWRSVVWYGFREATAPLNAFPLQRVGRLLHNGWPQLDMSQTVRRFRGNG